MTHTKDEALKLALDGQRHLVEILAENWRVWPAQKAVEQTCLGDVYCSTKGRDLMFGNHEIAVDQDSAVVTKEMWSTMRQTLAAQPAPVQPVSGVVLREGLPTLLQDKHIKETDQRLCILPTTPDRELQDHGRACPHSNQVQGFPEMTHITIEKAKLEKVFYALTAAKHGNLDHEWTEEVLAICKQALAAPTVQEPVAWREALERIADPRNTHFAGDAQVVARDALATPPAAQRQWVGLTDAEKLDIEIMGGKSDVMLAEMVEAKLMGRNT